MISIHIFLLILLCCFAFVGLFTCLAVGFAYYKKRKLMKKMGVCFHVTKKKN